MSDDTHDKLFAFEGNFVVAASAGTGKTYTLVGVLVHILLGASALGAGPSGRGIDPSRVVATTFSRKAAAEIRERLTAALEGLTASNEGAYRSALLRAFEAHGAVVTPRELEKRARAALERLSRARIGTLHSFAQGLVRERALELSIAPGFELLSEDEAALQAEETTASVIAAFAREDREAARALVRVAGGVDRLTEDVVRIVERLIEDGVRGETLAAPADDASEIERLVEEVVASAVPMREHKRHGPAASALVDVWRRRDEGRLEEALVEALVIRKDKEPTLADFVDMRDSLPGTSHEDKARRLYLAYRDRAAFAPVAKAARELVLRSHRELLRVRRQSSRLAFGDVLAAARDLLLDRPDVAQEIGASLDALLVDEFQDTSRVQCDLVKLLWEKEPLRRKAGQVPSADALRSRGLLVVGDRKQSIYGFRGADVSVFTEFCVSLAGWRARENLRVQSTALELSVSPVAKFVALRENWRSAPEILAFANAFSARHLVAATDALFEIDYSPEIEDLAVPAARANKAEATHVAANDTAPDKANGIGGREPRVTWLRPHAPGSSKRFDEARAIAGEIARRVAAPPPIEGKPLRFRDCAVLALTNQMLDTMAFALSRAEIPYVVAGRGFFSAREVRDVVALLALLVRNRDRLAWATVLRSPWLGASDETLLALTEPHRGLVVPARDLGAMPRAANLEESERARLGEILPAIERLRRNVDRVPAATLLREAMRALRLEEALVLLPRGAQRVSNVHKLVAMADRTPSARALLRKWERAIERESQETDAATFSDEDDAVRLLTIHASKGLSFPVVFVTQVGADRASRAPGSLMLVPGERDALARVAVRHVDHHGKKIDPPSVRAGKEAMKRRELAERRRLNYVALTRAEAEMILVGKRKTTSGDAALATPSATLSEMEREPSLRVVDESEDQKASPAPILTSRAVTEGPPCYVTAVRSASQVVAVTPLVDFKHCARRFQLMHLLEVPEELPVALRAREATDEANPAMSPREEGTLLHLALEHAPKVAFGAADAEAQVTELLRSRAVEAPDAQRRVAARAARFLMSDYARRVTALGASIHREVPFVLELDAGVRGQNVERAGAGSGDARGTVGLRGAIDLVVDWPNGEVDVLDYKRARGPSPEPYALQLDVYALATSRWLGRPVTRTGIVFLGSGKASEPVFRKAPRPAELEAMLVGLVERLRESRWSGEFLREPMTTCSRIRCGYVGLCHPKTPLVQLGLFGGG